MPLSLSSILLYAGAAGAVYFLVTMLAALIHDEPSARPRTLGLGLCVFLMILGALLTPLPETSPTDSPPLRYPPRVPFVEGEQLAGISGIWSGGDRLPTGGRDS